MADPADSDDTAPNGDADFAELHEEAVERFDSIIVAVQEERALALRDRRFATIAGAQWEGDWAEQFENSIMVEVNKTAAGVEKIISDYRQNRITVDFRVADDKADEDTAELMNGMFRADVYASKGQQAFDMAFEEAVQGGYGAFRLCNDWDDEYDPDNDQQRISFVAIPDADQSVFWDPNAKLYDKSDAKYAFVVTAMAREAFEDQYDADPADWPKGLTKPYYDWYTPDVCYVAEYYEVRDKDGVLRVYRNKATGEEQRIWATDLSPEDAKDLEVTGWELARSRRGKRRTVWKSLLSGASVLEPPKQIAGAQIPIVPVYGKRWFVDNQERARGHVRFAVDPQRIYNAQISKLTETAALAPLERPIFTTEQVAGLETHWAEANIKRAPYALINALVGADGNVVAAGPIGKIEPPQLSPVLAALVQVTASDIAELTTADDGADEVKANVSAEAMDLAATRTDAKSAIYIDNMRQSMQRCGEIWASMAPDVYFEDGRNVPTLSEDGQQHGSETLMEPNTDAQGRFRIRHDIAKGSYKIVSTVAETTATRRDKTVKTLMNAAQMTAVVNPQMSTVLISTALLNMDGEGISDLQDWIRSTLVQQGVVKPTDAEKQQMAQAAQQQQQQPDPQGVLAQAMAEKAQADTGLSKAKTILTLAQAQGEGAKVQSSTALAALESVHAEQDARQGQAEHQQQMTHAAQSHGMDMLQQAQEVGHAHIAHHMDMLGKAQAMTQPTGGL